MSAKGGYAAALMAGLKEKGPGAAAPANPNPTGSQNANPNSNSGFAPPPSANPAPVVAPSSPPLAPYAADPTPTPDPLVAGVGIGNVNGRGDGLNGDPMNGLNALAAPMQFAPVFTPGMGLMGTPGPLDASLGLGSGPAGEIAEATRDPLDDVLGQQFPCVRVQGVPYDAQCEEILMFFNDLTILDVVFSDRPGDAIVLFGSMMEVNLARARSGSNIRHRYVEIIPASRREYYDAVVTHLKTTSESGGGGGGGAAAG
eukprot:CAMPEP_0118850914 /NCGR_PEP_ID=MMETSP1163-20130328/556_1 /TAXON_ID=124430 /ORGANISM="Phaeomonas parva, Strain CCMP2877" /LENGTH=256 /DNA_ID=CAMNT_0006783159 /DNA_START=128 /DNA_END=894 /DNA_ORIENTATION=-